MDAFGQLGEIAWFIVLPVLLMIALGYAIQRGLGLDMPTLSRLNFYVVVPAIVYTRLVVSEVDGGAVVTIVAFHLVAMAIWGALAWGVAAARGIDRDLRRAMVMTSIFYNSGNYGLPLQRLAFRAEGRGVEAEALQIFVMVVQNLTSFTLGVLLATGEWRGGAWRNTVTQIVRFPPVYALTGALLTLLLARVVGEPVAAAVRPFWDVMVYAADGMVIVALVTLGAQLGTLSQRGRKYPVTTAVALRLLAGPAVGLLLVWAMGLEGLVAQVLLISTAVPTSVNCMLLCLEFDNHPDFVARSVFYSTLLSPVTVTLTILLAKSGVI